MSDEAEPGMTVRDAVRRAAMEGTGLILCREDPEVFGEVGAAVGRVPHVELMLYNFRFTAEQVEAMWKNCQE